MRNFLVIHFNGYIARRIADFTKARVRSFLSDKKEALIFKDSQYQT